MALGPKQMGEAVLRNLKAKTGKDATEWIALIREKGLSDKKDIIAFLKVDQGIGHFQAQKVYEVFSESDPYAAVDTFENLVFESDSARQLYDKLKASLLQMGKDIRVQPCKTYIPFYRKNQFAIAKADGAALKIGVNLSSAHPGFEPAKSLGSSARINYQTTVTHIDGIDQNLLAVLKTSYLANG